MLTRFTDSIFSLKRIVRFMSMWAIYFYAFKLPFSPSLGVNFAYEGMTNFDIVSKNWLIFFILNIRFVFAVIDSMFRLVNVGYITLNNEIDSKLFVVIKRMNLFVYNHLDVSNPFLFNNKTRGLRE